MDVSDVLVQELDERVTYLKDWLVTGVAKDYSEYQKCAVKLKVYLLPAEIS